MIDHYAAVIYTSDNTGAVITQLGIIPDRLDVGDAFLHTDVVVLDPGVDTVDKSHRRHVVHQQTNIVWCRLDLSHPAVGGKLRAGFGERQDRKSTRLNSSHVAISYAVFC